MLANPLPSEHEVWKMGRHIVEGEGITGACSVSSCPGFQVQGEAVLYVGENHVRCQRCPASETPCPDKQLLRGTGQWPDAEQIVVSNTDSGA